MTKNYDCLFDKLRLSVLLTNYNGGGCGLKDEAILARRWKGRGVGMNAVVYSHVGRGLEADCRR